MRIVSFSDVHGHFSIFRKAEKLLESTDIVLLTGDITDFGDERDIKKGISELRKYFDGEIFAITGNCDYPSAEKGLDDHGINLHRKVIEKKGMVFAGLGGSLITPFSTPNEYSEKDYSFFLKEIEAQIPKDMPLVLVAHQPPFDSKCDIIRSGERVGSKEVRSFIEKNSPVACFSGHIHESYGRGEIGDTIVINSGQAKKGYAGILDLNGDEMDIYLESIKMFK